LLLAASTLGQAQDEKKNIFFVSGLYDVQPTNQSAPRTLPVYVEDASYTPNWEREASVSIEMGYMRNIVSYFSVGVAYQGMNTNATERFTAQVPHPFYFNQPRSLEGEQTDLSYKEQVLHVPIGFTKTSGRLLISITAGPSYFLTETEVVNDLNLSESYPYDSVTLGTVETKAYKERVVGFNAGGLFSYRFHTNFAVGVDVRYSQGKVKFETDFGSEVEVDAGGLWAGVGIQMLF
jgi:hypothetical protein